MRYVPPAIYRSVALSVTVVLTGLSTVAIAQQSTLTPQPISPTPITPLPSAPLGQPAPQSTEVTLKPGDRIQVGVAGFPDLSGEHIILPDGTIQLPMAGLIAVRGLTPTQVNTRVSEALLPYVRRPQVAIALLSLSPIRITVSGEVMRPGPYAINPADPQNRDANSESRFANISPVTVSDALVIAGGIKPSADLRSITIRRAGRFNQTMTVNLWPTLQEGDLAADPVLQDGDEVVVPLVALNPTDRQTLLSSTVAPEGIAVQVAGEVRNPGQLVVAPTSGVSQAIAAAGGLTQQANRRVELLRVNAEGQLTQQTVNFGDITDPLNAGDLIVVRRRGSEGLLDVLGRLLPFRFLFD